MHDASNDPSKIWSSETLWFKKSQTRNDAENLVLDVRLQWEAHCEEDSMQDGALLIYYNIYQGIKTPKIKSDNYAQAVYALNVPLKYR